MGGIIMEIKEKIEELERELNELKAYVKINRPITERVKTFNDAVAILGDDHPFVKQLDAVTDTIIADEYGIDVIVYLKLRIITAALNEGWEPRFAEGECRYYPWYNPYTQVEWDKLDKGIKKKSVPFGGDDYKTDASFVYATSFDATSNECVDFGARLCFKTSELARYAGRQFADLYADFYLIRK